MLRRRIVEAAFVVLAGFGLGVLLSLVVGRYGGSNFLIGLSTALGLWYGLKLLR
ncbi:MAG: hypothetical protein ACTSUD_00605 [Alphaproteobacteria bacterium]